MTDPENTLRVYRDSWSPDHMALLCGIANAGGGALTVASAASTRTKGIGRLRKPFEQIPKLVQKELGITCTTYPVIDGPLLRLEIAVPAVDSEHPLRYQGAYWYYDVDTERNLEVSKAGVRKRREATSKAAGPQGIAVQTTPEKASIQELMQTFASLVDKLANSIDGTSVRQDGNRFVIEFPRGQEQGDAVKQREVIASAPNESANEQKRISAQELDPKAKDFSKRSIAAANELNLTSTDEFVLQVLRADGRSTAPLVANLLGVSESTVRRSFKQLKQLGLIKRIGSTKAGYWRVLD